MSKQLTRDQVVEIRGSLTLGDTMVAKRETTDDMEVILRAFHRRAQKLGFVNGESFEDFTDLIRVDDLKAISEAEVTVPLANVPGLSPDSAASGE